MILSKYFLNQKEKFSIFHFAFPCIFFLIKIFTKVSGQTNAADCKPFISTNITWTIQNDLEKCNGVCLCFYPTSENVSAKRSNVKNRTLNTYQQFNKVKKIDRNTRKSHRTQNMMWIFLSTKFSISETSSLCYSQCTLIVFYLLHTLYRQLVRCSIRR